MHHKKQCKHKPVIESVERQETSVGLLQIVSSALLTKSLKINVAGTFIRKNNKAVLNAVERKLGLAVMMEKFD